MRARHGVGCLGLAVFLVLLGTAAAAATDQRPIKPKPSFATNLTVPKDLLFCQNCARLDIRIFNTAGSSCILCNDMSEYLGLYAYFDPDLYIENRGTIASLPGTVRIEFYDIVRKTPVSLMVAIPAVPAGGWDAVAVPAPDMVFLKTDGIKMTIDYKDANRAHHRVRTITKCPDN